MLMRERGTSIFPECRVALVNMGAPAIPALIALLAPTSTESVALARRLNPEGSDEAKLPGRAAMVLSGLGDRKAVPALMAAYRQVTHEHATILMALGLIGGTSATQILLEVLKDKRASMERRTAAAEALAWSGDAKAIAPLLAVATSSHEPIEGERDLRVYAATSAVHLASPGDSKKVRTVVDNLGRKNPKNDGLKHAQEGLAVLDRCAGDLPCLAKALDEPSSGLVEAAAFALAHAQDRQAALSLLVDGLTSVCDVTAPLFQRRLVVLFAIRRLGDQAEADRAAKLDRLIERDEYCERLPGARELLTEMRITVAVLRHKQ
jgi:HEAT repeats